MFSDISNRSLCFLYCLFIGGHAVGMDQLGYTEQQIINKSLNIALRKLPERLSPSQLQNYKEILPISVRATYLEQFLSSIDSHNRNYFYIIQRISVFNSENLSSESREYLRFKLADSYAVHLSYTVDLGEVENSIVNRISTKHPIPDSKAKIIPVSGKEGTEMIMDAFPSGALSRPISKSEAFFILKLRITPKKRWFSLSPENFNKNIYIEGMAAALRTLAVIDFYSDQKLVQELKKYLDSCGETSYTSNDVQRALQQYENNLALDFANISTEKKDVTRKAFQELSEQLSKFQELSEQQLSNGKNQNTVVGIKLDNNLFSTILRLLAKKDNLFHIYNPMEFWIINIIYPKVPLAVSDLNYWRDSIIGSHRAKYITENAQRVFSLSDANHPHSE